MGTDKGAGASPAGTPQAEGILATTGPGAAGHRPPPRPDRRKGGWARRRRRVRRRGRPGPGSGARRRLPGLLCYPGQAPRTPTAAGNTPRPGPTATPGSALTCHGGTRDRGTTCRSTPAADGAAVEAADHDPTRPVPAPPARSRPGGSRSYLAGAGATPRLTALIGGAPPT